MKNTLKSRISKIHGKGLFSTVAIKKGALLGYCKTRKTQEPGAYSLWLEDKVLDVTCKFRFINHHHTPNVVYYDDLSVVAIQDIDPGDELTHYYGEDWEE